MRYAAVVALFLAAAALPAAEPTKGPVVRLNTPKGGTATIDVVGLDATTLDKLAKADLTPELWTQILGVFIEGSDAKPTPLRGAYRVEDGVIRFEPRFPLVKSLRYKAVFDPMALPGPAAAGKDPVVAVLSLPRPADQGPAVVEHVYPSRDELPENQLRFYIHFSAPMAQGQAYQHIKLLSEDGKPVESPFHDLKEELWDRDGKRFTLYIDPGRIKRGLKPREEMGPVLVAGKKYTLVIAATWPDADGNPLKQEFRKTFRATAEIEETVDPKKWKLQPPEAGGKAPVTVTFPRPLDHALLQHLIWVTDSRGEKVSGKVTVADEEMKWSFTPEQPWASGAYELVIDVTLEDTTGNNVARPFEVDVLRPVESEIKMKTVSLPFRVR